MPNRRKVLVGLGGSVALAGCTGETDDEEPEEESEPEGVAEFEFVNITPSTVKTINPGESIDITANIENVGNAAGEVDVDFSVGDYETSSTQELQPKNTSEITEAITDSELKGFHNEAAFSIPFGDTISTNVNLVYTEGDVVNVDDEVTVELLDSYAMSGTFIDEEPNGEFYFVKTEIENIDDEETRIGNSFFKLIDNDGRTYESDSDLNYVLEDGISGLWESLNPGISTTISVIFDIPEDLDEKYLLLEGWDGGFFGEEFEMRIEV